MNLFRALPCCWLAHPLKRLPLTWCQREFAWSDQHPETRSQVRAKEHGLADIIKSVWMQAFLASSYFVFFHLLLMWPSLRSWSLVHSYFLMAMSAWSMHQWRATSRRRWRRDPVQRQRWGPIDYPSYRYRPDGRECSLDAVNNIPNSHPVVFDDCMDCLVRNHRIGTDRSTSWWPAADKFPSQSDMHGPSMQHPPDARDSSVRWSGVP